MVSLKNCGSPHLRVTAAQTQENGTPLNNSIDREGCEGLRSENKDCFSEGSPEKARHCAESILFLGRGGVGNFGHGPSEGIRNEPRGDCSRE